MKQNGSILWIRSIITALVLCLAMASIGMIGSGFLFREIRAIAENTLPSLSHMALANQTRGEAFVHLMRAVNAKDSEEFQKEKAEVLAYSEWTQAELDACRRMAATAVNQQLFDKVMAERTDCLKSRDVILLMSESGDRKSADKELVTHFLPMYHQYLDNAQILVESLSRDGIHQADKIGMISRYTQVFTFVSCIIIFIFGFFLGYTR